MMDDEKKYLKNYPENEGSGNGERVYDFRKEEAQDDANGEILQNAEDQEPAKVYYPHQENWEPVSNLGATKRLQEEGSKDSFYYNDEYDEEVLPRDTFINAQPQKKKKSWGKGFIIALSSIFAVALIAFSSIGVYTTFFEKEDGTANVAASAEKEDAVVQPTTSSGNSLTVAEINEKIAPSVVGITGESAQGSGTGTGIVMSEDGYIMTNAHVVNGFSNLTVTMSDKTEYAATLVGLDTQTDLAVIKVKATGLTPGEFGNSDSLKVGDAVVAIGNPLGLDYAGTVTDGIISALSREVEMEGTTMNYLQTNAAINSGNSGGPLVNSEGQIIGINSAKIDSSVAEGMGFAIPINDALPIVNELAKNGYVSGRPMIGISGENIDEQTAAYNHVPTGVYVTAVEAGSAAEKAGIQVGSLITAIDGTSIASVADLNQVKNSHKPGESVTLTVYNVQTGQSSDVKVKLTEYVPTDTGQ